MRPLIIAGPTASGKSALALAIAERDGGVVINADALQVYACWRVLTARPDADACRRAPHRLYGHVACDAPYSVGVWLHEAAHAMAEARAAGRRPIIVGGAGLYLTALTDGLAAIPPIPPDVRARSDALLAAGRLDALVADLAGKDPETLAQIDRRNPMRVQRAWNVRTATGRGLVDWRRSRAVPALPLGETEHLVIDAERTLNVNSIRDRLQRMLEDGGLEECRRFRDSGFDRALPAARALGAVEFIAHLDGALTRDEALERAVTATRRYAKRQRTWFRNRMAAWPRIEAGASGVLDLIGRG